MHALAKLTVIEAKLFVRDTSNLLFVILLPTALMAVFASIPGLSEPSTDFGGLRFVDVWVPSLMVMSVAIVGLQAMPVYLSSYRENGILRRLSTTPVHPVNLLIAQLLVNLVAAVVAVAVLITVGSIAFDVPVPAHAFGFAAAFLLGTAALFGVGLVVAALVPGARAAFAIGTLLFMVTMFFGGLYVPRHVLPEVLVRVGNVLPPGVQALQDAWTGTGPQALHLLVMAGIAGVLALVAARLFRWE